MQDIFVFNEDLEKIKSIRIEDIKSNRLFSNTIRIAFDEENNYYILFEPNNEERGVFVIAKYNKNLEFLYSFRVEIEEGEGYGRDLEIDGNNFIYFRRFDILIIFCHGVYCGEAPRRKTHTDRNESLN